MMKSIKVHVFKNIICKLLYHMTFLAACFKFQVQISGGSETQKKFFPMHRNIHGIFADSILK